MERGITIMLILLIIISGCQPSATTEITKPLKETLPEQEKPLEPKKVNLLSIQSENFERVLRFFS